ncbi:sulfatase-like hydrolase/transferase [Thiocystis violacea]|uniref:sulfatase-like hydrolase/transferase n=1 Tax=Thiocystis violacea TaxID=13725 RepID=UPI00190708A4|nr:sulfatase-like hydrolase/transferase [Thiocystis violacea]MBK1717507.1 hypothetical protein [Thiocystis violacea]
MSECKGWRWLKRIQDVLVWVILIGWGLSGTVFAQGLDACGAPSYNVSTDTGLYLWQENCESATRTFAVRALAGGQARVLTYDGRIDADQALLGASPLSLESNDLLELTQGALQLNYRMTVGSGWYDGFNLVAPSGMNSCFGANLPPGTEIRVGPDATPIGAPFNLETFEPCPVETAPIVCGAPTLDGATNSGLYLWEDNCGGGASRAFTLRALAGGLATIQTYAGSLNAGAPLQSATRVSLESSDLLELVEGNQRLNYRLNVGSPWYDGFSFAAPSATSLCFGTDLPVGTQVHVGREAVPVSTPFDLSTLGTCATTPPPVDDRMNIVVILTDDQRWDTMDSTPNIEALASQGVRFSNAFVSYPVCEPVRTSMLSGGFRASNTGVISNNINIAPFANYNDRDTIAVRLQQAGYQTLYVGKYLSGYPTRKTYVPPGWTRWMANNQGSTLPWTGFTITDGSSDAQSSVGQIVGPISEYVTDFHRDTVLSFLDGVGSEPFFIFWAAYAPHAPATPADGDETLFSDFEYRDRAWGETDLSDKPSWVRDPNRFPDAKTPDDEFHRDQLRSLQALDRGVDEIVAKVRAKGLADRTVFLILSDNGYQWGEHGLSGKGIGYEESLRVPFIAFGPGIDSGVENDRMVLADLDLAPTIMDIAGVSALASDGASLRPLLTGQSPTWRDRFLVESWGNGASGPHCTWAALRTEQWKYILQASGEEELYDLANDPYEEESRHLDPLFADVKQTLAKQLIAEKSVAFKVLWPAAGRVGIPYSQPLTAWGGSGDYRWFLESGQLPAGLTLNPQTGVISGTPTVVGTSTAMIRVEDGTIGTYSGLPRYHRNQFSFTIR